MRKNKSEIKLLGKRICPECGGDGYLAIIDKNGFETPRICKTCGGRGKVFN